MMNYCRVIMATKRKKLPLCRFQRTKRTMASQALAAMFADDDRKSRNQKKFTTDDFLAARPELEGFLNNGAGITVVFAECEDDDVDGRICSPYYDAKLRAVVVSQSMPAAAVRTAVEVQGAFQYGALMLDERESHPDHDQHVTLIRILSHVGSARYMRHCLTAQEQEIYRRVMGLEGKDEEEPSLQCVAEQYCRWEDPAWYIDRISPIEAILVPVAKMLPCRDAVVSYPSVPQCYGPMERLRQILLRSVVDGNVPSALKRFRDGARKRLEKMYPGGNVEPFWQYFAKVEVVKAFMASSEGDGFGGAAVDYVIVLQVEAALSDLELHHRRR